MPAIDALYLLQNILDQEALEDYRFNLLLWASRTAMLDGSDAEKLRPKASDFFAMSENKTYTLAELLAEQEANNKSELRQEI